VVLWDLAGQIRQQPVWSMLGGERFGDVLLIRPG
jgi:L-alanine-DL-glutamate epimerase-like enolase superfamily enzyme